MEINYLCLFSASKPTRKLIRLSYMNMTSTANNIIKEKQEAKKEKGKETSSRKYCLSA